MGGVVKWMRRFYENYGVTATCPFKTAYEAHALYVTYETPPVIEDVTHAPVVTHAAAPVIEKRGTLAVTQLM